MPQPPDRPPVPAGPEAGATWDVVAVGSGNRDHLGLRLAVFELGLAALVVEPGIRDELRARRARVTHAGTPREQVLDAMRRARCVAVALRDPADPSGLDEILDTVALGVPLVVSAATASVAGLGDLAERGIGVVVADDTVRAWVAALRTALDAPLGALSAARLRDWRPPAVAAVGPGPGDGRAVRRRVALVAGFAAAVLPPLLPVLLPGSGSASVRRRGRPSGRGGNDG